MTGRRLLSWIRLWWIPGAACFGKRMILRGSVNFDDTHFRLNKQELVGVSPDTYSINLTTWQKGLN